MGEAIGPNKMGVFSCLYIWVSIRVEEGCMLDGSMNDESDDITSFERLKLVLVSPYFGRRLLFCPYM